MYGVAGPVYVDLPVLITLCNVFNLGESIDLKN